MSAALLDKSTLVPQVRFVQWHLPPEAKYVSVLDLASINETDNRENYFLVGMLLHVKASQEESSINFSRFTYRGSSSGSSSASNSPTKRHKSSTTYRKVFFFMDLLTRGSCFVIFERDRNDERRFWSQMSARANTRIGDILLIEEPQRVENTVGHSLSVVRTNGSFIPIERPPNLEQHMPELMSEDNFSGFHLCNIPVTLINVNSVDSSCTGTFCDRLFPTATPCGCYQNDARNYGANHVFRQDFVFNIGIDDNQQEAVRCSSLRFTELLFNRPLPANMTRNIYILPNINPIREALRAIVNYVNTHGGWTICGWFRSSVTSETGTSEQVFSHTMGMHISYVQPSDDQVLQDPGFIALQKDPCTFLVSANNGDIVNGTGNDNNDDSGDGVDDQGDDNYNSDGHD